VKPWDLLSIQIRSFVFLRLTHIFRFLSATDCHIGYAEKDPIRQNDSFNTFEEILLMAHEHEVSMLYRNVHL